MRSRFGLEIAFLLQPDHQVEEHGRHRLVVGRAAPVEIAVLLDQRERIALPVLALGVDHIDVREQQHALLRGAVRTDARDDVAVVRLARPESPRACRRRVKPAAFSRVSAARTTFVHEPVVGEESISTISS